VPKQKLIAITLVLPTNVKANSFRPAHLTSPVPE